MKSRAEVARIPASGKVPVTTLFSAHILGSGSASFEILRYLSERLPIMVIHSSILDTMIQPISIRNVLNYLVGCLEKEETTGGSYDIGGPDILTYRDLIKIYTDEKGRGPDHQRARKIQTGYYLVLENLSESSDRS